MRKYLYRVLLHCSILFNVILFGKPYQSFSARQYALWYKGYPNLMFQIDWFFEKFFNEKYHCQDAYMFWKAILASAVKHQDDFTHSSNTETKLWKITLDS